MGSGSGMCGRLFIDVRKRFAIIVTKRTKYSVPCHSFSLPSRSFWNAIFVPFSIKCC